MHDCAGVFLKNVAVLRYLQQSFITMVMIMISFFFQNIIATGFWLDLPHIATVS